MSQCCLEQVLLEHKLGQVFHQEQMQDSLRWYEQTMRTNMASSEMNTDVWAYESQRPQERRGATSECGDKENGIP